MGDRDDGIHVVNSGRATFGSRFAVGIASQCRIALLLYIVVVAASTPSTSFAAAPTSGDTEVAVPVVALLFDSQQAKSELGQDELKRLALTLPPTGRFLACVLQTLYCNPPVAANDRDRAAAIHQAMRNAFEKAGKGSGNPQMDDVSRILNTHVNKAFRDAWHEAEKMQKNETDRQILIVLVTPTIYVDIEDRVQPDLRETSIPAICFPYPVRPAEIEKEARMKLVLVVPDEVFPVSGVDAIARVVSNSGKNALEGVYQVKRACPSETENVGNWLTSPVSDKTDSCIGLKTVHWRDGTRQKLSCTGLGGGSSPRPLLESIAKSATAAAGQVGANSGSAPVAAPPGSPVPTGLPTPSDPPAPSGPGAPQSKTASKNPSGTVDPSSKSAPSAPSSKGGTVSAPDPAPPPAPPPTPPRAQAPPSLAPQPAQPPAVAVPPPTAPPKPSRQGPDPATVVAAADGNPPPAVTGALVRQQLVREVEGGMITIEFVRQGDGLDLTLGVANSQNAIVASSGIGNALAFNAPQHAGSFSILATPVARDPSCRSGRRVRGTVNLSARGVASSRIAVDLEVSRCGVGIKPILIGTLTVK